MKVFCPLSKTQAVLYQQAVDELASALARADGMKRRGDRPRVPDALQADLQPPVAVARRRRRLHPDESGKFGRLAEICEEIIERQEKVLVFTQFREMTEPARGVPGDVFGRPRARPPRRDAGREARALVDEFQREDGPPFFVLSLKAGGTGLNLTAASHVIHFDRWWNPAVENQATDRAFRIGQKKNVLVHKFVCRGTVEERIDALIEAKTALAGDVLDGAAEAHVTEMSDAELLRPRLPRPRRGDGGIGKGDVVRVADTAGGSPIRQRDEPEGARDA